MTDLGIARTGVTPGADHGIAAVLLPPVVHEASAAILVVDLRSGHVTYANDLARQLVPEPALPVSVDAWSAAAGLEDVAGSDLPAAGERATPRAPAESLLRIAQGQPVTGEAVTAARATAVTTAREVLWVLGLPLVGAPDPVSALALVVFVPARNARLISGVQESAVELRERAVLATRMSFTITDPSAPDEPLVWVNPAFTETTGYGLDEAVGRNCRFLQGPDTDRRVVAEIKRSLVEQRPMTTTLLNYRKDGSTFWNELSISPVRDGAGRVTHFVGVQADVTARVEAQRSRDDALAQVAEAADHLAMLADFTARIAMSQQPQAVIEMLGAALTPRLGTWTAIYVLDEGGLLLAPHVVHENAAAPGVAAAIAKLREIVPEQLPESGPIWRVLRGDERQVLVRDYDAEPVARTGSGDDERTDLVRELGVQSIIVVPLVARSGIIGCVATVVDSTRAPLGESELSLVRDLSVRAGLMLENTQLYARERAAAATLQRSLLPRLPRLAGLDVAASYLPAADEAAVGGDWYDVFSLRPEPGTDPDSGRVGVIIGDVMGHNYDSAARMGKLSTILRSYAWPGGDPRAVLTAVDELLEGTGMDILATCAYGRLTCHDSGAVLEYSSAGHPPALVIAADGRTELLEGGHGAMIGVARLLAPGTERPTSVRVELARGSTVVLFTDGLTDACADEPDMDEGIVEVRRVVAGLPGDASPRDIVDALAASAHRRIDDVAVVALRVL